VVPDDAESTSVNAVVFDLDGILVDSETIWDELRREVAAEAGRPWPDDATRAMQGMSTPEWSRYLHDVVGIPESPEDIARTVIDRISATGSTYHSSTAPSTP
jgi:beta-phosphoglucomutase-like phosphatase (HAD superfamily)